MRVKKMFVVGSGKLANAILSSGLSFTDCELIKWESKYGELNEKSILVHAGSGRQLEECFEFCRNTKSIFIELSTGLVTENMDPDFPLIICPNTSILLLKTMNVLKLYGKYFQGYKLSITESHQSSKVTEPGTAFDFAKSLKFPLDKVISIRDPKIQEDIIGIPKEFLDKHAYHKIVFKDENDEVTIETKVLGHDSYAKGIKEIVESVIKKDLDSTRYTVLDIIE